MHLGDVVTAAVIKTCKLYLYPHGKVGPRFWQAGKKNRHISA